MVDGFYQVSGWVLLLKAEVEVVLKEAVGPWRWLKVGADVMVVRVSGAVKVMLGWNCLI